jgi:ABC-2 type transport system permease protein
MRQTALIARRELGAYLRSWTGYVILAVIWFVHGIFFNAFALGGSDKRSAEVLSGFFYYSFGFTVIAAVLISMRLLAEERQQNTMPLLLSAPIRDGEIIVGKFLGGFAFLTILVVGTLYMPLLILVNGKVSFGHLAAGYLGTLLAGAAALAIGTFGSSLARSQILAAIISACITVALLISWMVGRITERPLSELFTSLALYGQHFPPFQAGMVHLRDVVYYLALTYVFLFAATRVLEARRWR